MLRVTRGGGCADAWWVGSGFKERCLKSSWAGVIGTDQGTVDLHIGDLSLR